MFEGIGQFFSQFQSKDWVTTGLALAAFAVSLWTARRRHWFDQVKQLEQQADFTVKWVHHTSRGYFFLLVTNVGKAEAFHVRVSTPDDPTHLLGFETTAQGPVRPDQYLLQSFRGTEVQVARGLKSGGNPWVFIIDWFDVYGEPRRQVITHSSNLAEKIDDAGWNDLHTDALHYQRGEIGSSSYQDLRTLPRMKKRWLRRKWVDRHGA